MMQGMPVITLPLRCCYTAVTLLLRCRYPCVLPWYVL